jgi:hypothetical protein
MYFIPALKYLTPACFITSCKVLLFLKLHLLGIISSAEDRGFYFYMGQPKDNKTSNFCFSVKHAVLRSKSY